MLCMLCTLKPPWGVSENLFCKANSRKNGRDKTNLIGVPCGETTYTTYTTYRTGF